MKYLKSITYPSFKLILKELVIVTISAAALTGIIALINSCASYLLSLLA